MRSQIAEVVVFSAVACLAAAPGARAALLNNGSGLASPLSEITFNEIVLANQTELLNTYRGLA